MGKIEALGIRINLVPSIICGKELSMEQFYSIGKDGFSLSTLEQQNGYGMITTIGNNQTTINNPIQTPTTNYYQAVKGVWYAETNTEHFR